MKKVSLFLMVWLLGIALPSSAQETYGPVKRGEDLWDIAKHIYPDRDFSRDQVILALLKANPQAFSHPCNANSTLKVGEVLQIPSVQEINALSKAEAERRFAQQNRVWQEHQRSGQPLRCPPETQETAKAATKTATSVSPSAPAKESVPPVEKIVEAASQEAENIAQEEPVWVGILVIIGLIIGILYWKFPRKVAPAKPVPKALEEGPEFTKLSLEEAFSKLNTDAQQGLTAAEASRRLNEVGPNALEEKQVTFLEQLLPYFWGPIPWMIEAAALLSLVTRDWNDFFIITALLLFNAFIGFREEHSAANALAALKSQLALKARVRRDGQWQTLESPQLVPGDIIRIRLGDIIPADAKLISGDYLSIDQAALTGESLPVNKGVGEMAFSGSVAKQGEMVAVVTATGAATFFGRTAKLVEAAGARSHLQESVLQVGNFLILSAIVLCLVLTVVELYWGTPFLSLLKMVLILVVASIPVAMPAVLSVTMALGALSLSKMKAIVSRLESIEEMAGVDVLCSDKTGTLTQNKLTLGEVQSFGESSDQDVILAGALASRAENNDAIDLAVIAGLTDQTVWQHYEQSQFIPFDPVGKRTESTVRDPGGKTFKVTKGAPQVILNLSQVDQAVRKRAENLIDDFAAKGFRTLGVARTEGDGNWRFLGLLPLYDPPREDSAATIAKANQYGIDVKMVTGDNTAIAREIARQLGIGSDIRAADTLFSQDTAIGELPPAAAKRIEQANGFAQVFPEHKYAIVKTLQGRGHIVAMTGDGVNDAPALKQADVGVAVSGATDAARAAAALVLTAPGLSVITRAVEEARRIFERMMSYVIYRIAMSIAIMVFVVLGSITFGFFPLTAIMLVALALLDDIPIMAIAYDHTEPSSQPVRWSKDRVFAVSLTLGFLAVVQSFGLLFIGMEYLHLNAPHLQTLLFLQLVLGGHLLLFLTRTTRAFWQKPYPSWELFWALIGTQIFVVFMTGFGWLVPPLPWRLIGGVWIYNLVWMVVQDMIKLGVYRLLETCPQPRQLFAGQARTFLGKSRQSAQPDTGLTE